MVEDAGDEGRVSTGSEDCTLPLCINPQQHFCILVVGFGSDLILVDVLVNFVLFPITALPVSAAFHTCVMVYLGFRISMCILKVCNFPWYVVLKT